MVVRVIILNQVALFHLRVLALTVIREQRVTYLQVAILFIHFQENAFRYPYYMDNHDW